MDVPVAQSTILEDSYCKSIAEIITGQNNLIGYGRISKIEKDALELVPCRAEELLPQVHFGTAVKINVFNVCEGFRVLSGTVVRSGDALLRIVGLEVLVSSDRRRFLRVKANAQAYVTVLGDDLPPECPKHPVKVYVEDISLCGIQFSTPVQYAPHSKVLIKTTLYDTPLELHCEIKRTTKQEGGQSYYYGCQFMRLYREQETDLYRILLRLQQRLRAQNDR